MRKRIRQTSHIIFIAFSFFFFVSLGGAFLPPSDVMAQIVRPGTGTIERPGNGTTFQGGQGTVMQPRECDPLRAFCNPIQSQNFTDLITRIAGIVAGLGIPVVAVVLVYAGFLFVSARGNEQKLVEAKQAFYWAIIGAALILGAFVIAVALKNFALELG